MKLRGVSGHFYYLTSANWRLTLGGGQHSRYHNNKYDQNERANNVACVCIISCIFMLTYQALGSSYMFTPAMHPLTSTSASVMVSYVTDGLAS